MAQTRIDELNILGNKNSSEVFDREEFIDHYFDSMQISEKQKKDRINAAKDIFDAVLLFLMWCENAPERVQEEDILRSFENMYKEVIYQHAEPDEYIDRYVPMFISNLIMVTLDHQGEDYFYSVERAAFNSANEANTIMNHVDHENAKALGYKNKTWMAEVDDRTRPDHLEMNGWTIPIDDWFIFDDCMGLFPHDYANLSQRQLANCRCSLMFS